jgi:catechol 2,3-dioxygenase-like lactoylglutathione lyase family enzyme
MDARISLITLGVSDLARARAFYVALGWPPTDAEDVVFFQAGPMVLALWDRARLAEDSGVEDAGRSGGFTLAYNTRAPVEVDAVIAEVRTAGGTVTREPGETFWGGYSAAFTDPDGHPWEVAHNPHWIVREDGSVSIHGSAG